MGRHLELVHDEEPDVAKIIKFTKNSAERHIAFDGLPKVELSSVGVLRPVGI